MTEEKEVPFQVNNRIAISKNLDGWAIDVSSSIASLNDLKAFAKNLKQEFIDLEPKSKKKPLGMVG